MNQKIKARWLAALRSGEFKQGTNVLHNTTENSYCCLGVLCKISGLGFNPCDPGLPENVQEWADLHAIQPKIPVSANEYIKTNYNFASFVNLASLNDQDKYTFEQIADLIEKYL